MRRKFGLSALLLLSVLINCPVQIRPASTLAFASDRAGHGDIFLLDRWGQLTNLTHSPGGDWNPVWSPDGRRLAFTSHQSDQADIWLFDLETGQQTNLTLDPAWDYQPTWSPDGQALAFVSERDGDAEIYRQPLDGSAAVQLTFNDHQDKRPAWSPDGKRIAFASVVDGIERLYQLDLEDEAAIKPLLPTDLNATGPVWSPDGNLIAFVGWEDHRVISLYTFNPTDQTLTKEYTSDRWLGSISWSTDKNWLFFTGRAANNHDLFTLNRRSGQVQPLTNSPAWDDFAALRPGDQFMPLPVAPARPAIPASNFLYGVNLADLSNAYLIQDIGFNAIKGYVNWATVEPEPGQYRWVDPDNVLEAAQGAEAKVLLRIHGTPDWARPAETVLSHPPTDPADFDHFLRAIATRYRGRVAAYEIWNEPNLNYEWGYRRPDPAEYTALLQTAYRAIKAVDPAALVISGGLAPTGEGNPPEALGELAFLEGMYQAGAKGYFDALGSHPYSYGRSPDFDSTNEITFPRLVRQRELMLAYEDDDTPIWITEMGWVLATHWDLGEFHSQGVDQLTQAADLRGAYEKIETDWPWVDAAFLFNLDFSTAPWYPAAEQMRWYAILNPDRTPRPAYTALREYRTHANRR